MTAPYRLMTFGERLGCLVAFLTALGCLGVVLTTPRGGLHNVAELGIPAMLLVTTYLARRALRGRALSER